MKLTDAEVVRGIQRVLGTRLDGAELVDLVRRLNTMLFDAACRDNSPCPHVGLLPGSIEDRIAKAVRFELRHPSY